MRKVPSAFKIHGSAAVATFTIIESPSVIAATAAALSAGGNGSGVGGGGEGGGGGNGGGGGIGLEVKQAKLLLKIVCLIPTLPLVCCNR